MPGTPAWTLTGWEHKVIIHALPCQVFRPDGCDLDLTAIDGALEGFVALRHEAGDESDWPKDEEQQDDRYYPG